MSYKGDEVVLPIVDGGDNSDIDSFFNDSDRDSPEENDNKKIYRSDDDDDDYNNKDDYSIDDDKPAPGVTSYASDEKDYVDDDDDEDKGKSKKKSKVKKAYGIDLTPPDELLRDARKQAKVLANKGKGRESVHELTRALAFSRIVYGDGHWQLAQSYVDLARGYLDSLGYAPQATSHAETAKQIMATSVQSAKSEQDKVRIQEVQIHAYYIKGRSLALQKKYNDAEKCFHNSEVLHRRWTKSSAVSDNDVDDMEVKITVAIAKLSLMMEKYANAATQYEKALEILEHRYGKTSKELIPIYQGLGKVELSKGHLANSEQVISMYETAHTISSGIHDNGSVPVAETGRALANAYSSLGGPAAETSAESYLNECLAIYLSHHGPNHKATIETKDEISKLMLRTDRLDDGIKELKSTINPKQEVYGEYSDEVADTHKLLANIYLAQGKMDLALRSYKNCLNVNTLLYGVNHKRTKDVQSSVDMLLANPKLAAKYPKSKQDQLNERPLFNSVVSRSKTTVL